MPAQLVLYSDFVCPFCFIAENGVVARLAAEYDLALAWRGFELHPDTPPGGRALADLFGAERVQALKEQLRRFAAGFGVGGLEVPDHIPNTRSALLLAEHARGRGRLAELRAEVMEAHWRGKRDIEDRAVLSECARAAGLDPAGALAALDDPALGSVVDRARQDATRAGVTGIPTFVLGARRVVGCQPYELVAAAAEAAGARRRPAPPLPAAG